MSLCVILLAAAVSLADATIQLPAAVSGNVGAFVQVPATTTGSIVKWLSIDPGLNLFPTNLLKDTKVAVVTSPTSGQFRLIAWTSDQTGPSEAAVCVITIGTPTPPPPPPPTDPLQAALQAAYSADPSPTKVAKKLALQALYGLWKNTVLSRTDLNTMSDIYKTCEAERLKAMANTDMASEQAVINAFLVSKFPAAQSLDATTRANVTAAFVQIAAALGAVQ